MVDYRSFQFLFFVLMGIFPHLKKCLTVLRGKISRGYLVQSNSKSVEKPSLKSKSDPSQEPAFSAAWPPRKECRVEGTEAAGRRLSGTGHCGVTAWPRPQFWFSMPEGNALLWLLLVGRAEGGALAEQRPLRHKRAGPLLQCNFSGGSAQAWE